MCVQLENMAKKMLIDATHAEETRVVVVDGNKVEEFDFESENKRQLAGNIYLAIFSNCTQMRCCWKETRCSAQ